MTFSIRLPSFSVLSFSFIQW